MNEQALNACVAELLESQAPLGFSTEAWERTLVPDVVVSLLFGALAFIETGEGRLSFADAKRKLGYQCPQSQTCHPRTSWRWARPPM